MYDIYYMEMTFLCSNVVALISLDTSYIITVMTTFMTLWLLWQHEYKVILVELQSLYQYMHLLDEICFQYHEYFISTSGSVIISIHVFPDVYIFTRYHLLSS